MAGLSQKTGAGKTQDKKYAVPAGLSDISISSDDDFRAKAKAVQPAPAPSIGGSKFLKSAKTPTGKPTSCIYSILSNYCLYRLCRLLKVLVYMYLCRPTCRTCWIYFLLRISQIHLSTHTDNYILQLYLVTSIKLVLGKVTCEIITPTIKFELTFCSTIRHVFPVNSADCQFLLH